MNPRTVDDYLAACPPKVQPILKKLRQTIRQAAPDAEEGITYRMPVYKQNGVVVWFGVFKAHIGLFPPVRGDAAMMKAVAPYAGPKGNLQFPLDRPVPYALIARIVRWRVKQNLAKTQRTTRKRG